MIQYEYPMRHHQSTIVVLVILAIVFAIGFLTSCGQQCPILSDPKHPFIIHKIKVDDSAPGFAIYRSQTSTGYVNSFRNWWGPSCATIELPIGAFNVGDTIK